MSEKFSKDTKYIKEELPVNMEFTNTGLWNVCNLSFFNKYYDPETKDMFSYKYSKNRYFIDMYKCKKIRDVYEQMNFKQRKEEGFKLEYQLHYKN